MAKHEKVVVGTEIKLKVSIETPGNLPMSAYNFEVTAYCNPRKSVTIKKEDMNSQNGVGGPLEDGSYYVCINTSEVGIGNLKVKVTAYLEDPAFDEAERTEIAVINTGIVIINDI